MRASIALAVLSLLLGARAASAQPPDPPAVKRALKGKMAARGTPPLPAARFQPRADGRQDVNLRVSFKVRCKELEESGNFIVESGTQANYVLGGETPIEIESSQGKGVEFKRHGTILNILPVARFESDAVDAQVQCEISGPLAPVTSLRVQPIATFQLQTEFRATLGKPTVLVDEPDRKLEITIEDAERKP